MTLPASLLDQARTRLYSGDYDPLAHRCSCGRPRIEHGGAKHTGAHPGSGCRRYRVDPIDDLLDRAVGGAGSHFLDDLEAWHTATYPRPAPTPGGWSIGPSDISTCPKAIQLRERPPEGFVPEPEDKSAALLGDMFHEMSRRARTHRYGQWRLFEYPIQVPGLDRPGRIDEYDLLLGEVIDLKTCGDWAWKRLGNHGPDPDHWAQLAVYAYALKAAGHFVRKLRLVYINRATGQDEQFVVAYSDVQGRAALTRLRQYAIALDLDEELPRDPRRSGPSSDPLCGRCRFRRVCWNMDAAEAAGRSPESYTILGPSPDMAQIEWAAGLVASYADDKRDATREYKRAKTLLSGVTTGRYGRFDIVERTRREKDWAGWATRVKRAREIYLDMPEADRGDFADWVADIKVGYRVDSWIEVQKVRAADLPATPAPKEKENA